MQSTNNKSIVATTIWRLSDFSNKVWKRNKMF